MNDVRWMDAALEEARRAYDEGEVPVGAVIVVADRIVGRGHNESERQTDPTAHAEVLAVGAACRSLGVPRLTGGTIYVTMEPCPMCAGAIVLARLARLVYGCPDPKSGYCGTLADVTGDPRLNHRVAVTSGVRKDECAAILASFFDSLRARGRGDAGGDSVG